MACFCNTEAMGRIPSVLFVCAAPLEVPAHLLLGNSCNTSSSTSTSGSKPNFVNTGGAYGVESRQHFERI